MSYGSSIVKIPWLWTALILALAPTWPRGLLAGERYIEGAWMLRVTVTDQLDANDRW